MGRLKPRAREGHEFTRAEMMRPRKQRPGAPFPASFARSGNSDDVILTNPGFAIGWRSASALLALQHLCHSDRAGAPATAQGGTCCLTLPHAAPNTTTNDNDPAEERRFVAECGEGSGRARVHSCRNDAPTQRTRLQPLRTRPEIHTNKNGAARAAPPKTSHCLYVPSLHPARYSSCSGVSRSILMPIDSSFNFATRLSSSSGTL
jgi:hypothetical protein